MCVVVCVCVCGCVCVCMCVCSYVCVHVCACLCVNFLSLAGNGFANNKQVSEIIIVCVICAGFVATYLGVGYLTSQARHSYYSHERAHSS